MKKRLLKKHIKVDIEKTIIHLNNPKKENIFDVPRYAAIKSLIKAQKNGQKFYTGCENVDENGSCKGHIV